MKLSNLYKAPKGLLRIEMEVINGIIADTKITGDFFMIPESALAILELSLKGVALSQDSVEKVVCDFYNIGVSTPMMEKTDIIKAILGAEHGS
jgi:hypothetical protein